ncbi:DUF6777 domain-containing protein [Streptomyces sp. NPDC058892]|uniref:DUF6777 domain-containing protein n=1 Tax=unclassified Streptomyces TaxID=2593676 RepID=UPI0036A46BCD
MAAVVVSAVVLGFTVLGGTTAAGGEVFLEAASAAGPDPFTPSTATETNRAAVPAAHTGAPRGDTGGGRTLEVDGGHPGLYGGTRNVASCDVEKQITFLTEHAEKGNAFAAALGVRRAGIPAYLRSLTPVRLGWDTRVTNHGYRNSAPTGYQAILQAGTSVLVDGRGVPRVRCACGNPLTPPVAVPGKARLSGGEWSSFRSAELVAVKPAAKPVKAVTVFDQDRKAWFERPSGLVRARSDREVEPPPGRPSGSPYPALPPARQGSVRTGHDAQTRQRNPEVPDPAPGVAPGRKPDPAQDPGREGHGEQGTTEAPDTPAKPRGADRTPRKDPAQEPGRGQDHAPGAPEQKSRAKHPEHEPGGKPDEGGPGRETGEGSGREAGQGGGGKDGRGHDKSTGQTPGQSSGQEPGRAPGQQTREGSGRGDGDGKEPGRQTDGGPRADTGQAPGRESGPGTGEVPGQGAGRRDDQGGVEGSGRGTGTGKAPQQDAGGGPGDGTGQAPVQGSGEETSTGSGQSSGQSSGQGSGTGKATGKGAGSGDGPVRSGHEGAGRGPGQESGRQTGDEGVRPGQSGRTDGSGSREERPLLR